MPLCVCVIDKAVELVDSYGNVIAMRTRETYQSPAKFVAVVFVEKAIMITKMNTRC